MAKVIEKFNGKLLVDNFIKIKLDIVGSMQDKLQKVINLFEQAKNI